MTLGQQPSVDSDLKMTLHEFTFCGLRSLKPQIGVKGKPFETHDLILKYILDTLFS